MRTFATTGACPILLVASILLGGCAGSSADDHTADKALRDLVDRTVAAAMKRDVAEYAKYYAPWRTLALPETPIFLTDVVGKDRSILVEREGIEPSTPAL